MNWVLKTVLKPTSLLDAYLQEMVSSDGGPEKIRAMCLARFYRFTMQSPAPFAELLRAQAETPPGVFVGPTSFGVSGEDSLVAAKRLAQDPRKFRRVAVLNFANEYNCGGAFSVHWGSQEEYLFRNSTLPLTLWPHRRADQDEFRSWKVGTQLCGGPPRAIWYPFPECGGVLSDAVEVFAIGDKLLPPNERFVVSVLTIAAQDLRRKQEWDPALLREKIRTMCYMAVQAECDALVLGALGCGAFKNPPNDVARAFFDVLVTELRCSPKGPPSPSGFRHIEFAIIKSKSNLSTFAKTFDALAAASAPAS